VKPYLTFAETHVWRVPLWQTNAVINFFLSFLSTGEFICAKSFHTQQDQERYIITRGAQRVILADYLHVDPKSVEFSYNVFGKPILAAKYCSTNIRFSLSRSHELCVLAISKGLRIGVDIEYIYSLSDKQICNIARSCLVDNDYQRLLNMTSGGKRLAFYSFWTQKEASLKANGDGHSLTDFQNYPDYLLRELKIDTDYIATLAIEDRHAQTQQLSVMDFDQSVRAAA
jgi:4'-phosphopantetheinyl transferase